MKFGLTERLSLVFFVRFVQLFLTWNCVTIWRVNRYEMSTSFRWTWGYLNLLALINQLYYLHRSVNIKLVFSRLFFLMGCAALRFSRCKTFTRLTFFCFSNTFYICHMITSFLVNYLNLALLQSSAMLTISQGLLSWNQFLVTSSKTHVKVARYKNYILLSATLKTGYIFLHRSTTRCYWKRLSGRFLFLILLPFWLLFLFYFLLFTTLGLILPAFVSHCEPPFLPVDIPVTGT